MLHKINPSDAKLNMLFSAPVFFDDGKYMFLAAGKTIKPYHLAALKRWRIPFLLTEGHVIEQTDGMNIERMAGFDKMRPRPSSSDDDIAELEEI